MKTFKQFLNEIHVQGAISVTSPFEKKGDKHIEKNYDLHHTSKMGEYDVSHGVHKKDKSISATFIHHDGKHVGTIYGKTHSDGKKGFTVKRSAVKKSHQGKNLMANVYHHLVTKHDHEIHSDRVQSHGGHGIWRNLNKMSGVTVSAHSNNGGKKMKPTFNDPKTNERGKNVPETSHYSVKKS